MILGNLSYENTEVKFLSRAIQKGLDYLKKNDFSKLGKGKHLIQGEEIFANVIEYRTTPAKERKAEVHKKYIDLQFIVSGEELVGIGLETSLNGEIREYSDEDDATLYNEVKNEKFIPLFPNNYIILFPGEIHRPGCSLKNSVNVKKVVIKISKDLI